MNKGLLMFTNFLVYYFYKVRVPVQSQIVKEISRAAAHYSENVISTSVDHHEYTSQKIAQYVTNLHTINFFGSKRFNHIQCLRHMIFFHSMQSINYIG